MTWYLYNKIFSQFYYKHQKNRNKCKQILYTCGYIPSYGQQSNMVVL